jgi:hypothetical protein
VFFDFTGIASGDFERVILNNIRGRAHFLVLLTPSALERCQEPGDWLRREITEALDTQRNIVPLMLEGFDFSPPGIANQLTGQMAPLKNYNALRVPADFFDEAMSRLRERYLNVTLDSVLHSHRKSPILFAFTRVDANVGAERVPESDDFRARSVRMRHPIRTSPADHPCSL